MDLSGLEISNVGAVAGNIVNGAGGTIAAAISAAIHVHTISNFSGSINNAGAISGNVDGILVGGTNLANLVSTFAGGVTNSGTISGNEGIKLDNVISATGGIGNGGTISVVGGGIKVVSVSTFTGDVTNSGTISGTIAIDIALVNTFTGNIVNNAGGQPRCKQRQRHLPREQCQLYRRHYECRHDRGA